METYLVTGKVSTSRKTTHFRVPRLGQTISSNSQEKHNESRRRQRVQSQKWLTGLSKLMGSSTPSIDLKRDRHMKPRFPNQWPSLRGRTRIQTSWQLQPQVTEQCSPSAQSSGSPLWMVWFQELQQGSFVRCFVKTQGGNTCKTTSLAPKLGIR